MQTNTLLETLDTHTAGEPTRIVTSGIDRSQIRGGTVAEQRDRFAESHDWLRELLMCEPRGHDDMFGAVPVDPHADDADLGLFFMDSRGYLDMCGHGTIGAVTALIETGQLAPSGTITVETPAGLVETRPTVASDRVETVTIRNVGSFVHGRETVSVEIDGDVRSVPVSIVFSGNVFALVDATEVGLDVVPENVADFVELGLSIRRAVNEQVEITDPFTGDRREVSIVECYEHDVVDRNVVIFGNGQVDRSPCGTGTCAKMTLLHYDGKLDVGETYEYESIIGTRFTGTLEAATSRDGIVVTTPEVRGSAHITGRHTFLQEDSDELAGFSLSRSTPDQ